MFALHLKLKSSLFLTLLFFSIYCAAAFALFLCHFSWKLELVLLIGLVFHFIYVIITYVWLLRAKSNVEVIEDDTGQWFLINKRGQIFKAAIRGDSVITRFILILNFTVENHHGFSTLLIARDSLDAESFRRAVVALKP